LPKYDVLDVAFLQTVLLDAAGLPLTPAQQERTGLWQYAPASILGANRTTPFWLSIGG
jgi:hypothetical protein